MTETCCGLPLQRGLPLGWKPPRLIWLLMGWALACLIVPGPSLSLPLLGLPLLGLGVVMAAGAKRQFLRLETPVCPTERASLLVRDGWFARSRNPMYLGAMLMLSGTALSVGHPLAVLSPVVFAVVAARCYVPREEARMAEDFGPAWDAYTQRVRRWF